MKLRNQSCQLILGHYNISTRRSHHSPYQDINSYYGDFFSYLWYFNSNLQELFSLPVRTKNVRRLIQTKLYLGEVFRLCRSNSCGCKRYIYTPPLMHLHSATRQHTSCFEKEKGPLTAKHNPKHALRSTPKQRINTKRACHKKRSLHTLFPYSPLLFQRKV